MSVRYLSTALLTVFCCLRYTEIAIGGCRDSRIALNTDVSLAQVDAKIQELQIQMRKARLAGVQPGFMHVDVQHLQVH